MSAAPPVRPEGGRSEIEDLRRDIERLRAFVELRTHDQEDMVRAMLTESVGRAAEALEGRIQLAAGEAMAFAEQGLQMHEAALRALGRRVGRLAREEVAAPEAALAPATVAAYLIGVDPEEARACRRLDIRDDSEDAFLADLANLPILPGGAAKLVAGHVVEYVPARALAETILPHWRSRLAPGGELVVVTLDGPAWAAGLADAGGDFADWRRRLGADGTARPPRNLFEADGLSAALRAAGLSPQPPASGPSPTLRIVARASA